MGGSSVVVRVHGLFCSSGPNSSVVGGFAPFFVSAGLGSESLMRLFKDFRQPAAHCIGIAGSWIIRSARKSTRDTPSSHNLCKVGLPRRNALARPVEGNFVPYVHNGCHLGDHINTFKKIESRFSRKARYVQARPKRHSLSYRPSDATGI